MQKHGATLFGLGRRNPENEFGGLVEIVSFRVLFYGAVRGRSETLWFERQQFRNRVCRPGIEIASPHVCFVALFGAHMGLRRVAFTTGAEKAPNPHGLGCKSKQRVGGLLLRLFLPVVCFAARFGARMGLRRVRLLESPYFCGETERFGGVSRGFVKLVFLNLSLTR